jgi:hypothetical protein
MDSEQEQENDNDNDSDDSYLTSEQVINELEMIDSYDFEQKWYRMLNQHKEVLHNFKSYYIDIKYLDISEEYFLDKYLYLSDTIRNYIDEFNVIYNYIIKILKKEINEVTENKNIQDINCDVNDVCNYVKDTDNLIYLSELTFKLSEIRKTKMLDYSNNLIVETKLLSQITDYEQNNLINFMINNNNSTKGNMIIVMNNLINTINIDVENKDLMKKLNMLYMDFIRNSLELCQLYDKIVKNILNNGLECDIFIFCKNFDDNPVDSIKKKQKYYYKMSKLNTLELFLNEFKEPINQYNNDCPICFIELKEEKCITKCGHVYCLGCIKTCLENKKYTCPMCNEEL